MACVCVEVEPGIAVSGPEWGARDEVITVAGRECSPAGRHGPIEDDTRNRWRER